MCLHFFCTKVTKFMYSCFQLCSMNYVLSQFLTDYWYGASADYQGKTTVRDGNPAYFYIYKYNRENHIPNDWDGKSHTSAAVRTVRTKYICL